MVKTFTLLLLISLYSLHLIATYRNAPSDAIDNPIDRENFAIFGTTDFIREVNEYCSSNDLCITFTDETHRNDFGGIWYREAQVLEKGLVFAGCINLGKRDSDGGKGVVIAMHSMNRSCRDGGMTYKCPHATCNSKMCIDTNLVFSPFEELNNLDTVLLIEIDTHDDGSLAGDIPQDHIALKSGKDPIDSFRWGPYPVVPDYDSSILPDYNIERDSFYEVRLTWDPVNNYIQLFINKQLRLGYQEDISSTIFKDKEKVIVGAIAAVGDDHFNLQQACLRSKARSFDPIPQSCLTVDDTNFDFWYQTAHPDNGFWPRDLDFDRRKVRQMAKSEGPTFLVSPFDLINAEIDFIVRVEKDTFPKNAFGVVFGYQAPFGNNIDPEESNRYDTWVLSWRGEAQTDTCGNRAEAGFKLVKLNGTIPPGCGTKEVQQHFFAQTDEDNFYDVYPNDKPEHAMAWRANQDYRFKVRYTHTATTILLSVDDTNFDTLYHIEDCFQPGRVGFYNFGQPNTLYTNFSYQYLPNFNIVDSVICVDDSAQFIFLDECASVFDYEHIDEMIWDFGDQTPKQMVKGLSPSKIDQINPQHPYERAGRFTVSLTVLNKLGCANTITREILVEDKPGLELANSIQACAGSEVLLSPLTTADNCLWSTGESAKEIIVNSSGEYSVSVSSGQCENTTTVQVNFLPPIEYNTEDIRPSCAGQQTGAIFGEASGGMPPYQFLVDLIPFDGDDLIGLDSGLHEIRIIDFIGCEYIFEEDIPVFEKDQYTLGIRGISCEGQTDGELSIETDGNFSFSLDGFSFTEDTLFDQLAGGPGILYIKDSNCVYEEDFYINESGQLKLSIPNDTLIQLGQSIKLQSTTNALNNIEYSWEPDIEISCIACPAPIVSPTTTRTYRLKITNQKGCSITKEVTLFVDFEYGIYIPNVFTPNGDGLNDLLTILAGKGASKVKIIHEFRIFNRWGELVFTQDDFPPDDFKAAWDGRYKGKLAPQGVYPYYLMLEYIDGHQTFIKGNITLIR